MDTQNTEQQSYRPCVGLMLLNSINNVFVGKRLDYTSKYWQMPQGGIENGEKPLDAALREMLEEIGNDNSILLAEHPEWLKYDLPENLRYKLWGGRYRGQVQKWYIFRFVGKNSDISIETPNPEFSQWKWLPIDDLTKCVVPFKAQVYESVVAFAQSFLPSKPGDS